MLFRQSCTRACSCTQTKRKKRKRRNNNKTTPNEPKNLPAFVLSFLAFVDSRPLQQTLHSPHTAHTRPYESPSSSDAAVPAPVGTTEL